MDKVVYNGTLAEGWPPDTAPDRLLSAPYLYQRILTFGRKPLHARTHMAILADALRDLHGIEWSLSAERLQREVAELLTANRFPARSNGVTLRVFPTGIADDGTGPDYLLEATGPLFYPPYTLWHKRLLIDVFRCDLPFASYPTALSLLAARWSREQAERNGADAAVLETGEGILTHIDGEPLFAVFGRQIMTTPTSCGVPDTVMRRAILAAARAERLTIAEYPLTRGLLERCDEAFTASVQGIVSILGYRSRRYFNTTAVKLSERLREEHATML